jgi:SAM-dependent methyltransferase
MSITRRPFRQSPALRALLLQGVALVLALLIRNMLATSAALPLSPLRLALLQGLIAAVLSRIFRQARWWQLIQLLFPVAALLVNALHLPPPIFLGGFLFFLLLFWSTFRTQVPYYPSRTSTWQSVDDLLPADAPLRIIDIGSGLGGFVLSLARRRTSGTFAGIEIAPLPWLVSELRARCMGSRAKFMLGDYTGLDFADYDVIFAYLSPVAMTALWDKARSEMHPGSLLLSYEFPIEGIAPDITINASNKGTILYGWRI